MCDADTHLYAQAQPRLDRQPQGKPFPITFSFSSQRHQSQGGGGIWAPHGVAAPISGDCAPPDPSAPTTWPQPTSVPCKITPQAQLPAHAGPVSTKIRRQSPKFLRWERKSSIMVSFAFLLVTLNQKGFKRTENKFQLIKSHKAVDFEEVWF